MTPSTCFSRGAGHATSASDSKFQITNDWVAETEARSRLSMTQLPTQQQQQQHTRQLQMLLTLSRGHFMGTVGWPRHHHPKPQGESGEHNHFYRPFHQKKKLGLTFTLIIIFYLTDVMIVDCYDEK